MTKHNVFSFLLGLVVIVTSFFVVGPALAFDNPDLLPSEQTPVIDLAKSLTTSQKKLLETNLENYEQETGWKIRVLSQFDRTPGLAVRQYWHLDERSLLIVADPRGGNLLNFNVGDAYYALMPRTFWVELQTRYGNQYYIRDNGEDSAILDTISSVQNCLNKGGCQVVPGLPKEQWLFTFSTSVLGGLIAGIAAYPRQQNRLIAWSWLLLLSPLWVMLFGVFGITPIVTRTNELLPLLRNIIGFSISSLIAYFIAKSTFKSDIEGSIDAK